MTTILIAEDEQRIASFLEKGLGAAGFSTDVAADGVEALRLARAERYGLVILDLGLPALDGAEVLRSLREEGSRLPAVVLTQRQGVDDAALGLEEGLNEYLVKPFRFAELVACVQRRLRGESRMEATRLRAGDTTLDLRTGRVLVGTRSILLDGRELELARALFRRPGRVVTRGELLAEVWGYDFDPGSTVLDTYVGYLRRRLGRERITTVRRVGYRLETQAPRPPAGRRGARTVW